MADQVIRVDGLPELRRALRQVDAQLQKDMNAKLKEVAELVAVEARRLTPRRTGRAANSIKAKGNAKGASLAVGGTAAPYFPWLDYGGSTKVPGAGRRVQRSFVPGGRIVYPALAAKSAEVTAAMDQMMTDLARRAGFDTDGSL